MHNAAYAECGLDWAYGIFRIPAADVDGALRAARALGLAGLNITMPYKADAALECEELSPTATTLGAVNTVRVREDARLFGDSTDGPGLLAAIAEIDVDPAGRRFLVLGAGGAGRAIALALGEAGAEVTVAARRLVAARAAATLAGGEACTLADVDGMLADVEVVVNVTPLGMQGEQPPFDASKLEATHVVVDTIYHPAETPLLAIARDRGATVANGLAMLVHQAALAFRLLTGMDAPLATMRAAAEAMG